MVEIDLKPEQDKMTDEEMKVFELFEKVEKHELSAFKGFMALQDMVQEA